MNSTSLEDLVTARRLRREPFNADAVGTLLARAAHLTDDAARAELAPASRFALGVEAAFALASAALYLNGYRYDSACNQRAVVFQSLAKTLSAPTPLWATLAAAEERRAALDEGAEPPTPAEVDVLLERVYALEALLQDLARS
jgi:hypothetical protein